MLVHVKWSGWKLRRSDGSICRVSGHFGRYKISILRASLNNIVKKDLNDSVSHHNCNICGARTVTRNVGLRDTLIYDRVLGQPFLCIADAWRECLSPHARIVPTNWGHLKRIRGYRNSFVFRTGRGSVAFHSSGSKFSAWTRDWGHIT
jgi:hypothetical protein